MEDKQSVSSFFHSSHKHCMGKNTCLCGGSTGAHVKYLFSQFLLQTTTKETVTFKLILTRHLKAKANTFVYSFPFDYDISSICRPLQKLGQP